MAYKCTKCDATFSSREALRKHQFSHLYDASQSAGPDSTETPLEDESAETDRDKEE